MESSCRMRAGKSIAVAVLAGAQLTCAPTKSGHHSYCTIMLRSVLILSLLASTQSPSASTDSVGVTSRRGDAPEAVLTLPEGSCAIVVEKATQSLFLYQGTPQSTPELIEIVQVNTGEEGGDKQYEGDLRTPEGIYFFTGIIDGNDLPAEYGVRAFVTDYPNIFDRLVGKHGNNIWLHATNEPERISNGFNTRGCVVVTNKDLDRLTPLIRVGPYTGSTVLIVKEKLHRLEPAEARALRDEMRQLVARWEAAWESMDIDRYMNFYSRAFRSMGSDYNALRAYKGRLTRQYEYVKVDISNLHIFAHDGEMIAAFDQRYESDRYRTQSAKRLYFKSEEDGWKIVAETSRNTPLKPAEPEPAEAEIRRIIADWEKAWESMDTDSYIAFYSKTFRSRGMDYAAYHAYKDRLNRQYKYIKVDISNLRIFPRSGGMVAAFDQLYESDGYRAQSSKRLYFVLEEEGWRIVEETSQDRL